MPKLPPFTALDSLVSLRSCFTLFQANVERNLKNHQTNYFPITIVLFRILCVSSQWPIQYHFAPEKKDI